jgi:hypothetical protein
MMEKIVVPTKFNKTGKRVLSVPLDEDKIYAPAYQEYRKVYRAVQDDWKRKHNLEIDKYVEKIAHWIASYIAKDSTPDTEKYRIAKFLAEQGLAERAPMNITGPRSSKRWSVQLGDIPELSSLEEEAWEAYVAAANKADKEKEEALSKASIDCADMKRALAKEISEHIQRQHHPEDMH